MWHWYYTLTIFHFGLDFFANLGHYQALGRVIHMSYVQEQLATQKKVNFAAARDTMDLVQQLDILADTVYIQVIFSAGWYSGLRVTGRYEWGHKLKSQKIPRV